MLATFRTFVLIAAVAVGVLEAFADQSGVEVEGILVLRNGNVLRGAITPYPGASAKGDRLVRWPNGSARVAAADIEMICRDIEEAYQKKRQATAGGSDEDRLRLAHWLINQRLYGYAARELLEVRASGSNHPALTALERRLESATSPKPHDALKKPAKKPPFVPNAELDAMVEKLPADSLEQFTRGIQPLLVNGCAAAACHGPRSDNAFRLERTGHSRSTSHRVTQRNLYAVLRQIESEDPARSPLLIYPSRPHGGLKTAVFDQRQQRQYHQLVAWVARFQGWKPLATEHSDRSTSSNPQDKGVKKVSASSEVSRSASQPHNRSSFFPWQAREAQLRDK